jgi:hypothetical protein
VTWTANDLVIGELRRAARIARRAAIRLAAGSVQGAVRAALLDRARAHDRAADRLQNEAVPLAPPGPDLPPLTVPIAPAPEPWAPEGAPTSDLRELSTTDPASMHVNNGEPGESDAPGPVQAAAAAPNVGRTWASGAVVPLRQACYSRAGNEAGAARHDGSDGDFRYR